MLFTEVPNQKHITEIGPREVFQKKLNLSSFSEEEKNNLMDAFNVLLEEVYSA
jgi:hypothetical protein